MVLEPSTPLVSILCNTYNHERYITKALDGFLMQETDFPFEILVHDDASIDGTQSILRRYEKNYPNRLKIIYQAENQYSQGRSVNVINLARAKGRYIAFCEGDDYWTDRHKLQKQMDVIRQDSSITLVVHASLKRNVNNPFVKKIWCFAKESRYLDIEEIILNRGIVAAHSSYFFINQEVSYPVYFKNLGVMDTTRMIYHALHGRVYYLNDVMSVYQVGVAGSWNERIRLNDTKMISHYKKELEFYETLLHHSDERLKSSIVQTKAEILEYLAILKGEQDHPNAMVRFLRSHLVRLYYLIRGVYHHYWIS